MKHHVAPPDVPRFDLLIDPPDLRPWMAGNTGIPGIHTRHSGQPGPHVLLLSLMHGNEFAGAIVLDRLLRQDLRPLRGTLSIGFVNLAAFARFDARHPTMSRFVDEDLNRLWDETVLAGPRRSIELDRARELRPLIDSADVIMDLHSMLWPSDPLILCGSTARGRALGQAIGWPPTVVADAGHANGSRLIDFGRFAESRTSATEATAILVEAGQHWRPETVDTAAASVSRLLQHLGLIGTIPDPTPPGRRVEAQFAIVTDAVMARTNSFTFTRAWYGGDVVAHRNSVIAMEGLREIRTPYDNCLLVMPSLRPGRGHTAVRLAKLVP